MCSLDAKFGLWYDEGNEGTGGHPMKTLLLLTAILSGAFGMIVLYCNGCMVIRVMSAAFFCGSMALRRCRCHAKFRRCTGYCKGVLRWKEAGAIHFTCKAVMTSGRLTVLLLDPQGQVLRTLVPNGEAETMEVSPGVRYRIKILWEKADGECWLDWE